MKELAALAYRDTTAENREFWKNEMGQALREIQQVYDDKMESMRAEMETFYNLKVIRLLVTSCETESSYFELYNNNNSNNNIIITVGRLWAP